VKTENEMPPDSANQRAFSIPLPNGLTFTGTDSAQKVSAKFLSREIFHKRFYDRPGFQGQDGFNVVDIGANMGLFALWMSPQIGSGRICCVEPTSAFETLAENARYNNLTNVHMIRCAAGAPDSTLEILEYPEFNGVNHSAVFTPAPWGQFFIRLLHRRKTLPPVRTSHPCRDLASILDEVSFEKVDLLKIDCEGGEYEILDATTDLVLSRIDRVCMEFHELHPSHDHRKLAERLNGCGFDVTIERPWFERIFQKTGTIWAIRPEL
jgi:FkbM family methyltransferase